jgi:hypothetical protein
MKYSKKYIKEKWESIKHDMENILLRNEEDDYVDFPEGRMIKENLNDKWVAIKEELKL